MTPKDHSEAVALHRSQVIGSLTCRELPRGELAEALLAMSQTRFRSPRSHSPQTYSVATLERWYYAYKDGGLDALKPRARADRGRGRDLTAEQRDLLLGIRQEHPSASVPVILRTLMAEGRLGQGDVSASTVRRLFQQKGLDRVSLRQAGTRDKVRLRWQAECPGALWHGDVCYGAPLIVAGKTANVRIHGMLDDASRYIVALEAMHHEREVDMLGLLVRAVRRFSPPTALYLDNGSTYRGDTLALATARMGTTLVHAKPYDPQARGKMERFWRTLREGCLDFIGSVASLHEINVRLYAWLDEHYHKAPHAALMGQCPKEVFAKATKSPDGFDEDRLRKALTVQERRRVRRDSTLAMDGKDWETDLGFLAGRLVTVSRCLVDPDEAPWIEHENKRFTLRLVDPVANSGRPRVSCPQATPPHPRTPFDPNQPLLDKATGRTSRKGAAL